MIERAHIKNELIVFLKWVKDLWSKYPFVFLFLLFLGVLSGLFEAIYPLIFRMIIDKLAHFEDIECAEFYSFCGTASFYLLLYGFFSIFIYFYPGIRGIINHKLETIIREKVFKRLLKKEKIFFTEYRAGDLLTRLTDDISGFPKTAWFLCSGIFRAFNAFCILVLSFILMWQIDISLTLMSLSALPFTIIVFIFQNRKMKIVYQNKQAAVSRTTSHIESAFSGIDILKSYTAETDEINRFENEIKKRSFYEIEAVKIEAFFSSFFPNLSFMGQFLIVVLGGNLISTGDISLGEFYAFFNYLTFLFLYGIDIAMFFISGKQAMVSVFRLIEIENHPQEINYNFNDIISGKFVTSIEVKNIFLKNPYNDNEFILNNINFTIPGGTWISIVGPVGAGKSVLLEILAGIIKPDKGDLFFNGKNLKYISRNQISNFRGYVPTEPIIFSCSIKENIELFRKLKYENVEFSSSIAQLINEIQEMPFKFDQKVGDKGMLLSGGQKQRLSIARALAHNPFLLILDDVTSSLDSENENAFFNSLEQKFKGLTCIYATHRLKTAQKSDLIICLKDGEIAGSGTHQHLLKNCSIYIDMIASQSIK